MKTLFDFSSFRLWVILKIRALDKRNKTVFLRVETLTYIHRDTALKIVEMYTTCCDDDGKAVHLRIKHPKVVDT